MSFDKTGTPFFRRYDYAALAKKRERESLLTLDPNRKAALQAAARYARRRATAAAVYHSLFPRVNTQRYQS